MENAAGSDSPDGPASGMLKVMPLLTPGESIKGMQNRKMQITGSGLQDGILT